MTRIASTSTACIAPAALTDALLRWSGMVLLAAVVIVNEATLRVVEPDSTTFDWQSLLRLSVCGLCGLYGLIHLPGIHRCLLRFPGVCCLVFAAWAMATAPVAISPAYSFAACVALACAVLFAPAVLVRLGHETVIKTLIAAFLFFAAACWVAQFTKPELGQPEYLAQGQEPVWRLGGLTHPNGLGGFCALAIGCLGVLGIGGRVRWRWLAAPLAFFAITLWLTDSRTSQAAVSALVAVCVMRRLGPARLACAAALLAAAVLAAELASVDWSQWLVGAAREGDAEEVYSINGRTELWDFAIEKAARSPWLGYGFGSSRFLMSDFELFPAAHPHQLLLDGLLETGVFGVLLLVTMMLTQLYRLWAAPAAFADMVTVLVMISGLTETPIFNPVPEAFTLCWLIALFWRDVANPNSFCTPLTRSSARVGFQKRIQLRPTVPRNYVRAAQQCGKRHSTSEKVAGHVVLLTNFIPPYRVPVYAELARRVERLTILLSTPMESNRKWTPDWGQLDVRLQRTMTVQRPWRHATGFCDTLQVHLPYDTLGQLRLLRPDVIVSAELGFRSALSSLYSSMVRRTPLVLWATLSDHTEQGRGLGRHWLRRWLLPRAEAVVVNGESGARYVERYGVDRGRTFRVPYVALPGLFERLPATRPLKTAHRLLYVGQLIERKGLLPYVNVLTRWAADHPQREVAFDLAGSGPVEDELRQRTTPPNLQLRFLGERSYDQLADAYAAAGIFVFPTLADEWGLVVNEAMAAGLPVLGSRYSQAVEELCRHSLGEGMCCRRAEGASTGWTFRPDAPDEMYAAIDRALSASVEELNAMRVAARGAVARLTPEHAVDGLIEAIRAAMNKECHA
ncbi:MAG TPA: glycosyltransferase [Pirellulales bacterium]|nr:glycosyltransferase [Pirellulales bacterium]